ncbi:30S ribosomal protein S6 [Buchnera aphidicola (Formosaphis micheliae)]|uniref:30S ribosomal protein S6 n=1 Tax=Buchnera aphidicola TaxID=9 RepID=UPI0031B82699
MRHYEIIFMIHPDQSENVQSIIEKYKLLVVQNNGNIHRLEDWGRRQLAYSINKLHKAHYILMNIEIMPSIVKILENNFKFDSSIIRNMVINVKRIINEPSPMTKLKEDLKDK